MTTDASPTTVQLTSEEAALLVEMLQTDLRNLREEVYKTERYEWRQELKHREELINGMLQRLGMPHGA